MKAIAFAQRLMRDIGEKDLASLTAADRLELVDAINGGLGKMHLNAPPHSKNSRISITLPAPKVISISVEKGSHALAGYAFDITDLFCSIFIEGDGAENQIGADGVLLFPYSGETGTVSATIYHDAAQIPEPVEELISDPENIDTGEVLLQDTTQSYRNHSIGMRTDRRIGQPTYWATEENASNRDPVAPSIFRVDSLPDRMVRLTAKASMGPARVSFQSILDGTAVIPLREDQVETFLLPICRGILTSSSLWRDAEEKPNARKEAKAAENQHATMAPRHLATPSHKVFTPRNF